jgi:asparagine synthase (glutamine-hydrolysing)
MPAGFTAMRFFTFLMDGDGHRTTDVTLRLPFESLPRSRQLPFRWQAIGGVSVLTGGDDEYGDPLVVNHREHVGIGVVRLDNRQEVERWTDSVGCGLSDLELALRTVIRHGTPYIPQLLGDFGFVVWNSDTRTLIAVCDAFAIKKLYYAKRNGLFAISSRAEALAPQSHYDVQYLAEFVTNCIPTPGLTVYDGVHALPGGTMLLFEQGALITRRYWSASDFEPQAGSKIHERELARTCRELLADALRARLAGNGCTWAQLSGGLDSSSLISMVQSMAEAGVLPNGLAGTVTYVDRVGTGSDEREYSNAVVSRWGIRNETIIEPSMWYDRNYALPRTDQPRASFLFYPRERQLSAIVRGAGGRVLLTGVGGDELLTGTMFFFADWVVRGLAMSAVREMIRWAAIGRVSFWELAYRNALLPLMP